MNLPVRASSDAQPLFSGPSPGIEREDSRDDISNTEVLELATCFCLHQQCRDWFSSVPFATKVEVSLVLRPVAGHLIEPPAAKTILERLISTVSSNEAGRSIEFLVELASKDISAEIEKNNLFRWHWTNAEDCALFSALLQGKLALFKWWSGRSSFALRQRFSFWRRTWKRMLFTTQDDVVIVDEEEEVHDDNDEAILEEKSCEEDVPEESYGETVRRDEEGRNEGISLEQINSCFSSQRSLGK